MWDTAPIVSPSLLFASSWNFPNTINWDRGNSSGLQEMRFAEVPNNEETCRKPSLVSEGAVDVTSWELACVSVTQGMRPPRRRLLNTKCCNCTSLLLGQIAPNTFLPIVSFIICILGCERNVDGSRWIKFIKKQHGTKLYRGSLGGIAYSHFDLQKFAHETTQSRNTQVDTDIRMVSTSSSMCKDLDWISNGNLKKKHLEKL